MHITIATLFVADLQLLLVFCLFFNRLVFYPFLVWRKEDAIDLHVDIR